MTRERGQAGQWGEVSSRACHWSAEPHAASDWSPLTRGSGLQLAARPLQGNGKFSLWEVRTSSQHLQHAVEGIISTGLALDKDKP